MPPRPRRSRYARPAKAGTIPGAKNMAESKFQAKIGQYALHKGLLHYHTHNSERSEGGFPDSVIVGEYVMYRELKSDSDSATVSPKQRKWIEALEAAGVDVDIWWPVQWESGEIQDQMNDCARKRKSETGLVIPDVAKLLFLFSDLRPAAGLLWDAGAKGIDRVTWKENSAKLMRAIAHGLPRTDAEILTWLSRHDLGSDSGAAAFFDALRRDLISNGRGGDPVE